MFVSFVYLGVVLFNLAVCLLLYRYRKVYPGVYNVYVFLLFSVNLVLCFFGCYGDKSFAIGIFTVAMASFFLFLCVMERRIDSEKEALDLILEALEDAVEESDGGADDSQDSGD